MAVNLSPYGGVGAQFLDNAGNVLTGGKIFTYAAGTTTNQAVYTTSAGNIFHPNPIILDASGRVPSGGEIWLTDGLLYKFVLTDSNDVLIATYDNIAGINSNFVNFVNQQEIQTATAGQTVFNLATVNYAPSTNSLSVFVDGVNQYGPGAQYAYLETDSDTVTFVNGLHVGASVKFTTSQLNSSGATDAIQVSYDPPFANSVETNVEFKLAQTVSLIDFGAVGDGVTDDTAAVVDAEASTFDRIYVPEGQYLTTYLNANDLSKVYYGNGQLIIGGYATARVYSNKDEELPAIPNLQFEALDNQNIPETSFHTVTPNVNPSPLPTSYTNYTQYAQRLGYMQYTGGFNTDATDHTLGRSGAFHRKDFVYHAGQGDLTNQSYFGSVSTARAGATHFLANPALIVENGNIGATGSATGAYLNHSEYVYSDNGLAVACIDRVRNYIRTNSGSALSQIWIHDRPQSNGTQPIDCVYSVSGSMKVGLDFTPASLTANKCAIALKADDRIYYNSSTTPDPIGAKWYATNVGTVYTSGTSDGFFNVVSNNITSFQVSNTDVLVNNVNGLTILNTGLLRFNGTNQTATGSSTASFVATNKPGATTGAGPSTWLTVSLNGQPHYIPCWAE
jgi:hypothetical protein